MNKLAERSTLTLTRSRQAGRGDSAEDNETCSRPSTDLRESLCRMRRPSRTKRCGGAMTAEGISGLEYSSRWGCVTNTAQSQEKPGDRPLRGHSVLQQPQLSRCSVSLRVQIDMEYPCPLLAIQVRGWRRSKGGGHSPSFDISP